MWFKDAIGKALGEAAGKVAAQAQALLVSELRGLAWRELQFESIDYRPYGWQTCLSHIRKYGKPLYVGSASVYNNTEPGIPIHTTALFRYKNTFLLIRRHDYNNVSIYYPRSFDIGKMLRAAAAASASTYSGHFDKNGDLSHKTKEISAKHLHLSKEHTVLESDLRRWLHGEVVFREAGLPHRRGWLLYGKPGNGKTTCVQQLAVKYDMHIDVALFHKGRLITAPLSTKRFILIEDIDNIFRGREPLNPDADFGNFLNAIDGVNDLDNCIVVITTNDLSAIDPAIGRPRDETQWNSLSTRPGRIDRCIYFDNPDHEARLGIARKMLPEDEAVKLAGEGDGLSVAQFSALVRERAMEVVSDMVGEGVGEVGKVGTGLPGTETKGAKRT